MGDDFLRNNHCMSEMTGSSIIRAFRQGLRQKLPEEENLCTLPTLKQFWGKNVRNLLVLSMKGGN